jgi:hypothetical protein
LENVVPFVHCTIFLDNYGAMHIIQHPRERTALF